ncbi:chemotaxis protein CheA [Roseateles cellulosilyticus]|uniref:Chemotaxis protein CheA n=1 Tax=Pelomonas cellulosilytica TaxID=2906762 RepID=A0ABS8XVJ6_9BURK|nr:chemotaxis protein CheA [Pelomonas sp. P8]MCE4556699.1 chemotaxis protein CheA [Pelomonas sp. P8]
MTLEADFIAEALPAFLSEADEQVENLEALLLQLEDRPDDAELLNALFRCAHTVKGSAGVFGLDAIVDFTHHVETLLQRLREGQVTLTPDLSTLLLRCNDQIRGLVGEAGGAPAQSGAAEQRDALVAQLQAAAGIAAKPAAAPAAPPATDKPANARPWHVSVAFGRDVFRNGMDPLTVLNYVRGLGDVPHMVCDVGGIPPLETLDAESCHLSFIFALVTEASRAQIEDAFSFVREDCQLHVLNPGATPAQFADLIDAMPGNPRLGEILVAAGAISPAQLQQGLRSQQAAAALGEPALLGELLTEQTGLAPQVVDAALRKQRQQRSESGAPAGEDQRFIRVQANRLDAVINLLGELVIAGAGAALLARQSGMRALIEANEQISHLIEDIRNGTLQLRMVPIGETFSRFRRVVRDTATELGKDVQLEIVGGDTELDKSVVERIADPLMHLVRNALDHGLETAEQRVAAGKPAQGRLTLSAHHEAGNVVICITDDGRGIQRRKVLERAWDRGLVEPGVVPDDATIQRLIFEPGFSTAEKVTNLSGRGVGMDVVRSNIEALRGTVLLNSVEGEGSTIEIRMPLTLAIIDGFLIGIGDSRYILPLDAVVEVIEDRAHDARLDARGRGVVELRGQVLPVVSLRALYGIEGPSAARSSIVVLKSGRGRFGVLVDSLLGHHQTVIKPLGRLLGSLRGMAGSTILGNGDVALIFDVPSLAQLAEEPRGHARGTAGRSSNPTLETSV